MALFFIDEIILTFRFRLLREYEEGYQTDRAEVFVQTVRSGLVPIWQAAGVYESLYNSDGMRARDISRALAYGLDRLNTETVLRPEQPHLQSKDLHEAIEFLEKLLRACVHHPSARIETS